MNTPFFTISLIILASYTSIAQVITFDDQGHVDNTSYGNPYTISNNGETFVFTVSGVTGGPTSHRYRTTDPFGCGNTGLSHLSSGSFGATTWTIETQSGNQIDLGTIRFDNFFQCYSGFAYDLSIEGFKNNVSTGTQQLTVPNMNTIFNPNSNFNDVDRIVITCADLGNLGIDDITWSASTLDVPSFSIENSVTVYQDESSNVLKIVTVDGIQLLSYTIYTISGNKIANGKAVEISTASFTNGIYILKLDFNKGSIVEKVIIN